MRLHDPRPDAGVDPPPTGSLFGRITGLLLRPGTLVVHPCWAQYDLVMLSPNAPPPPQQQRQDSNARAKAATVTTADSAPHAFLEFVASVEADERPLEDDGWLRTRMV